MKKTLTVILMCFITIFLTGCGFFEEEEALLIEKIEYTVIEEENVTKVTVSYLNEDKQDDVFYIPHGEIGEQGPIGITGNGIASIEYEYSEDGFATEIKITYTDEELEPTIFNIPNGRSVSGVRSETDRATGNTIMYLQYSDGTESDPIIIRKGVDGNSIIGYNYQVNEDLSVTITFQCSQSDDVVIQIPAPLQGEQGVGVDSMISSETTKEYVITVKYTDGNEDVLKFTKPKEPSDWSTGSEKPSSSYGKNGDYFFDTYHKIIYLKEDDVWVEIVDFNSADKVYTVQFNLNDTGSAPAAMPPYSKFSYTVKANSYFKVGENGKDNGAIPIPTRTGYTFAGWYTDAELKPTSGLFTDLTQVCDNMTLYAHWVPNE